MAASLRITPLDRNVLFQPGGALDAATAAKAVAAFAREQVAAAAEQNAEALGHEVEHDDFVNGVRSTDYDAVQPGKSIVAVFDLGSQAVQWIEEMVLRAAPRLTGAFQKSIVIYADGVQVDSVAAAAGAAEIVITSTVPYARKIERGESSQAPDGVFQGVAALAAARYGNQASIKFTYREPTGSGTALDTWARGHSGRAGDARKQRRQYAKDTRQPAIVITPR